MKKKLIVFTAVIICLFIVLPAIGVNASDFGGFSGGSNYGGGGDRSSGGSGFDLGDLISFAACAAASTDSNGEGCSGGGFVVIIVVICIIIGIVSTISQKRKGGNPVQTTVQRTASDQIASIQDYITSVDPNFKPADMQSKLSNLYVQLQNRWCERDLTPLRPYLTDEMYNRFSRQIEQIKNSGQTPHIERIAVLGTNLRGWFRRDGMDHIIAELSTRIVTYHTDDKTGKVVLGDMKTEKFMTYEWDVARTTGVKTEADAEMKTVNCPNCGAPLEINKSAKCPYCESVITLNEHDWVLYDIKGLSQRSN